MVLFNSNGRIYDRRVYNNIYKSCLKIPCDVLAPFDVLMFQAMANFHLGWLTKKGPHNTPKYSVFPALLENIWDLWGPFLVDQSKWKINSSRFPKKNIHAMTLTRSNTLYWNVQIQKCWALNPCNSFSPTQIESLATATGW